MKPELELKLATALLDRCANGFIGRLGRTAEYPLGLTPRAIVKELLAAGEIQNTKQADWTFLKWSARDWYDYGVCLDLGWLTPAGLDHFSKELGRPPGQPTQGEPHAR